MAEPGYYNYGAEDDETGAGGESENEEVADTGRMKRKSGIMVLEEEERAPSVFAADLSGGSSCHQCKSRRSTEDLTFCANQLNKKNKAASTMCRKKYCEHCLKKFYKEAPPHGDAINTWKCPACRGLCCCAACRKRSLRDQGKGYGDYGLSGPADVSQVDSPGVAEDGDMDQEEGTGQDMMYFNHGHHAGGAAAAVAAAAATSAVSSSTQHPSLFSHVTQTTAEDSEATSSSLHRPNGGTNTTSPSHQHHQPHYSVHHHWPTSPQTALATLHSNNGAPPGGSHLSPHQGAIGYRATLGGSSTNGHPRLSPSFEPSHPAVFGLGPQAQKILAANSAGSSVMAATPASTGHGGSINQSPLSGPVNVLGNAGPAPGPLGASASVAQALIRPRMNEHLQQRHQQLHGYHHHNHHHAQDRNSRLLPLDADSSPILSAWQTSAGASDIYTGATPLFLQNQITNHNLMGKSRSASPANVGSPASSTGAMPSSGATGSHATSSSVASSSAAVAASAVANVFASVAGTSGAAHATNGTTALPSPLPMTSSHTNLTMSSSNTNNSVTGTASSTLSSTATSKTNLAMNLLTSPALSAIRSNPFPTTMQSQPQTQSTAGDFHTFALCWVLSNNPTVQVSLSQICSSDMSFLNKVDSVANALKSAAVANTGINFVHSGSALLNSISSLMGSSNGVSLTCPTSGQLTAAAAPLAPTSLDTILGQAAAVVAGPAAGNAGTAMGGNRFVPRPLATGATSPAIRGTGFVSVRQSAANSVASTSPTLPTGLSRVNTSRVLGRTNAGPSGASNGGDTADSVAELNQDSQGGEDLKPAPVPDGMRTPLEASGRASPTEATSMPEGNLNQTLDSDQAEAGTASTANNDAASNVPMKPGDSVTSGESLPVAVTVDDGRK